MQHLRGEVKVLEAHLAFHGLDGERRGIPRRVSRLARGHLLGRDDAARTHLVRGGVDGPRTAVAAPVAAPAAARPVTAARTTVATARCTVLARWTLLLLLSGRPLLLLLPGRTRLLLFLRTRLLPAARAAVSMTAALAAPAAPAAVLLRAVRRALSALRGGRVFAGDLLDQLLEKSKCHSAFLQSVNAKGRRKRNFHGGPLQASPAARGRAARRRVPN